MTASTAAFPTPVAARVRRFMFWIVVTALALIHAVIVWRSIAVTRLWEDEAFNLTVPLNLLRGLGYTSDGMLSGSELIPFDARISTGPVVLLPMAGTLALGGDVVISARLVTVAFWIALLIALAVLGRRIGGAWAALVAVAMPLALETAAPPSPIQGPADILGEIPAAALAAWALVVLARRPWLAGLLLGLAIQSKYIALLFVPGFVLAALFVLAAGRPWRRRMRALVAPAALVIAPTALVELIALVSLGPAGYIGHLRATGGFLRSGGQNYPPTTVVDKLTTLASHWFVPTLVAAVLAVVALAVWALAWRRHRAGRAALPADVSSPTELRAVAVAAGGGLVLFIGWWASAAHTPLWIRHPSPALFALVPVAGAFTVLALRMIGGWVRAAGAVLIAVSLTVSIAVHVQQALTPGWESLDDQRIVADRLAALGGTHYAAEWGAPVSIGVLSGAHIGLWDAGDTVADWPRLLSGARADVCEPPATDLGGYLVCAAASTP